MERFIWTINGKKFNDAEPLRLRYGERVRLKFTNETMMAHPMHLHGMFVQLENGQPAEKLPNKHTVIVAPGQSYSVLLTADEAGEWAFHCHMLFHMLSGMMTKVVVAKFDAADIPKQEPMANMPAEGSHSHAH
jgi:FtsP/CotA-like multicopper oxidase with cupredoxin domain